MKGPFIRSAFNYDLRAASDEAVSSLPIGESLTVQSMGVDCDMNVIMQRYGVTGRLPENIRPVFYGDFSEVCDFRSAQDAIVRARESFDALDPKVRERFANDPQKLLEFCENPDNIDEARKMGLAIPKEKPHAGTELRDSASSVRSDAAAPGGGGGRDQGGAGGPGVDRGGSAGDAAGRQAGSG